MEKYQTALLIVYGVGVVLVPIIMGYCVKPEDRKALFGGEGVFATLALALLWPLVAVLALALCVLTILMVIIGCPFYFAVAFLMCIGTNFQRPTEASTSAWVIQLPCVTR